MMAERQLQEIPPVAKITEGAKEVWAEQGCLNVDSLIWLAWEISKEAKKD